MTAVGDTAALHEVIDSGASTPLRCVTISSTRVPGDRCLLGFPTKISAS